MQQKIFNEIARRRMASDLDGMARYAAQQTNAWVGQTTEAMGGVYSTRIVDNRNDPNKVDAFLKNIDQLYASRGQVSGQSAATYTLQAANVKNQAINQAITTELQIDPGNAQNLYNQYSQYLSDDNVRAKIQKTMQPVVQQAQEDYAYKYAKGKFNLSSDSPKAEYDNAFAYVMNPDNSKELGIDGPDARNRVASTIYTEGNRFEQARNQQQADIDSDWMNKGIAGMVTPADVTGSPMTPEKKAWLLNQMSKDQSRQNTTDKATWNHVYQEVLNGNLTNPSDLLRYSDGLSTTDIKSFGNMIQTGKKPYFDIAMKAYDKRYADQFTDAAEGQDYKMAFTQGLTQKIKDEGLTGPAILSAAKDMFADQDKALGIGNTMPAGTKGSSTVTKPIPAASDAAAQQPVPIGTYKDTGLPVYRMPDGTITTEPGQVPQPQHVGVHKTKGSDVFLMPDNSYATEKPGSPQEGGKEEGGEEE
jgi:hypothetical protein